MNGKENLIQELVDTLDKMLVIIEDQAIVEPEFESIRETAEQLREEITALED